MNIRKLEHLKSEQRNRTQKRVWRGTAESRSAHWGVNQPIKDPSR